MAQSWKIEKLDINNYATWKFQMKHLLIAHDYYGIINGTDTQPGSSASADNRAAYRGRCEKAFSTLVLSVSSEVIYLIRNCENVKDAWEKLEEHFQRNSLANKLYLKKCYFRATMTEGTRLVDHLRYMKELADKLSAIESPISEEDQIVALLGSVPDSYSNLVTVLESRDNLTIQIVQQALLNEEQKRNENTEVGGSQENSALAARHRGLEKTKVYERGSCYKCGSKQHYQRDCPDSANGNSTSMATLTDDEEVAFVIMNKNQSSERSWIIDSAASSHMTPHRELFIEYQELTNPISVIVGDGYKHSAIGSGSVRIKLKTNGKTIRYATLKNVLYIPDIKYSLVSIRAATENGMMIMFGRYRCWIKSSHGRVVATGTMYGKLYRIDQPD